jgi:hypothetical protein
MVEAPVPRARITMAAAFSVCGVDFAGPLWVKNGVEKKAYICLFSCAVTRAIHLEVVSSQEIDAFLLAFRRFIARRGRCRIIYSDNSQTFKMASRLLTGLHEVVASQEVQGCVAEYGVDWRFIVARAAWWGGFYERMVRSIKIHLQRTLGKALLSFEELTTILSEIEMVMNSRPLTYLGNSFEEGEALTPSHLILGRRGCSVQNEEAEETTADRKEMNRRWRFRKKLIDGYWERWRKDYIFQLKSLHEVRNQEKGQIFKIGDIVLIMEDKLPRAAWKLAKIEEIVVGRDQKVRSLILKTGPKKTLRRAIQQVCPLEVVD